MLESGRVVFAQQLDAVVIVHGGNDRRCGADAQAQVFLVGLGDFLAVRGFVPDGRSENTTRSLFAFLTVSTSLTAKEACVSTCHIPSAGQTFVQNQYVVECSNLPMATRGHW